MGFGLESRDLQKSGLRKLKEKSLELIILQKVTNKIKPFGDRKVLAEALYKNGKKSRLGLIEKKKLSSFVIREAEKLSIVISRSGSDERSRFKSKISRTLSSK